MKRSRRVFKAQESLETGGGKDEGKKGTGKVNGLVGVDGMRVSGKREKKKKSEGDHGGRPHTSHAGTQAHWHKRATTEGAKAE
jgi:hypothetical protein